MPSFMLGIDFGTTNSVMAAAREDGVDVVPNDIGNNKTPSVVHIEPQKPWVRLVGESAQRLEIGDPQHTIRNFKRILGYPPKCVQKIKPLDPIKVVNSDDGDAVSIKLSNGLRFSPEEVDNLAIISHHVVAMLLLELKKAAKLQLGEEVCKVTIAVPCFFSAAQRQAITNAAFLADLEVAEMVNETTAAAAAYAFDRGFSKTVLMVDVGGGSSCASVVRVEANELTVLACSARMPGGLSFDSRMMDYLKKALFKGDQNPALDQRSQEILRSQWVEAKRKLSQLPQAIIQTYIPELKVDFRKVVTRTEFECECGRLFKIIIQKILEAIECAKIDVEKLDDVVLVGGGSRIPKLRELIVESLGDKLCKALNPDEAVAIGAALIGEGKVSVKKEVLGLFTRIRLTIQDSHEKTDKKQGHEWCSGTPLPLSYPISTLISSTELMIEQGEEKEVTSICEMAVPYMLESININERGQLGFSVRSRSNKPVYLKGCIPESKLEALKGQMIKDTRQALEESDRVLAKNALEDVLRRVKSDKSFEDSPFSSKYEELREECLKHLDWIDNNHFAPKHFFENIRVEIERKERTLREEFEREMCRQQEMSDLTNALNTALAFEVSGDEFQKRLFSLKEIWNEELKWLSLNQKSCLEEYRRRKQYVIQALSSLTEEYHIAVALKQRNAAENNLRIKMRNILTSAEEKQYGDSIDKVIWSKLKELYDYTNRWLKKNHAAPIEELNETLSAFEASLVDIDRKHKQLKEERELERTDFYKKVEDAVRRGKDLQTSEFHVVPDAASVFKSKCKQRSEWLRDHPNEEIHDYRRVYDEVMQERESLEKKRAAEIARIKTKHKLQNILEEALKADGPLCSLSNDCLSWLQKNPQATQDKMEKLISRVTEGLRESEKAQKSFEDANAANAQAMTIIESVYKDLDLKLYARPSQNEDICVNGNGYCPDEYTSANVTETRDPKLVGTKGPGECNGLPSADAKLPAAPGSVTHGITLSEAFAIARTHVCRLRPDLAVVDPTAHSVRQADNDLQVFQCLSEAMAVRTLQDAARAGSMALLVCKAAAAGRELLSLAVRFVEESGEPVERLLVVRELGRNNCAENCTKHLLFTPFLELCKRAKLNWRENLLGVCHTGAGVEGWSFITHLKEVMTEQDPTRLDCGSVPLDWRLVKIVQECATSRPAGVQQECLMLSDFFSTIDALRSVFAVGGRWYQNLLENCRSLQLGSDPWLTYSSSCRFVSEERSRLGRALKACELDPTLRLLSKVIYEKILGKSFILCLEICTSIFSSNGGYDDSLVSGVTKPSDLIGSLETAFSFKPQAPKSWERSSKMRSDAIDAKEITVMCEKLSKVSLEEWKTCWDKFVFPLLRAVCDTRNKPTTRSHQGNCLPPLQKELATFFNYFPDRVSSLQDMLCCLSRSRGKQEYPNLHRALLNSLTVPLLPPRGKRALEQLRAGVFFATGPPDLVGPTTIIMSMNDLRPEDRALSLIWEESKALNGKV
ncbi:Heat shock 70 kDa protein [Frankliniella fusca]|uniref:Heat shock 70 kDa protein n=1 Tax=Frankliniella fusca TaxID=407009 RepID=A0AAE1GXR7_9NEOP|nr:Heat shock 70 kDa protein [Frankliniella fusca]